MQFLIAAALLVGAGCGGAGGGEGSDSGAERDASGGDAGTPDAGDGDAGSRDAAMADAGPPFDAGPVDGGPPAFGTVETFADVGMANDGIAIAPDGAALFVSVPDGDRIVRIDAAGVVTPFATVPRPRGIARDAAGTLFVCGRTAPGATTGAIWRVDAGGTATSIATLAHDGMPLMTPDGIAMLPGAGGFVFSDSDRYLILAASIDGSGMRLVSALVAYPDALAFRPDASELLVSSFTANRIFTAPYDRTAMTFMRAAPAFGANAIDGLVFAASGDLYLISNDAGLIRRRGTMLDAVADDVALGTPANGAFGLGALGTGWLYVTDLRGPLVRRVWIGEAGAPLPAP